MIAKVYKNTNTYFSLFLSPQLALADVALTVPLPLPLGAEAVAATLPVVMATRVLTLSTTGVAAIIGANRVPAFAAIQVSACVFAFSSFFTIQPILLATRVTVCGFTALLSVVVRVVGGDVGVRVSGVLWWQGWKFMNVCRQILLFF